MKRYLFLADLHGNYRATMALDAALPSIRADEIWFLGDAVGKGPSNAETCDWVRAHCGHFLGGNWDYGIGGKEFPEDGYFWNQLGPERMAWLNGLPREAELTLSGLRFRLFHGRPVTSLLKGSDASDILHTALVTDHGTFDAAIFADSHRPFIRTLNPGYILNTGSVGVSMGMPRCHALVIDAGDSAADPLFFTILSIPYDREAAIQDALDSPDLPHQDAYIREIRTGIYSR
ncbi:MAG: metallophosphoesterase family protein [Clostridia bacterium]|nr:metallophosphoesterase family protein [Clostridia bacterium]